jgi:predicted O-methyltransferase YrrM
MNIEHLDGGSIRRTDDPGEPTTGVPRISIADDEIDILTEAARGKIVLEIGTGLGVSTRAMAVSAQTVITVDPDPWVRDTIAPTLPRNVLHIATIDDIPDDIQFTMAFIDGDHSTESTRRDIMTVRKLCTVGTRIWVHDAKYPNVAAALDPYIWEILPTTHGLAWWDIKI